MRYRLHSSHGAIPTATPTLPRHISPTRDARRHVPLAFPGGAILNATFLGLIRRPVLALTLAICMVLLISAVSEAVEANRLAAQVNAQRSHNAQLQAQLTQTAQQVQAHSAPSAIVQAAEKLGWKLATPTAP